MEGASPLAVALAASTASAGRRVERWGGEGDDGSSSGVQDSGEANAEAQRHADRGGRDSDDTAEDSSWSMVRESVVHKGSRLSAGMAREFDDEEDDDENDDWMLAHLTGLERRHLPEASAQMVDAGIRAALGFLDDGRDSRQEQEDGGGDTEGEGEKEEGEEARWAPERRQYYVDVVHEAMEARWTLGSPNQHLLNVSNPDTVQSLVERSPRSEKMVKEGEEGDEHAADGDTTGVDHEHDTQVETQLRQAAVVETKERVDAGAVDESKKEGGDAGVDAKEQDDADEWQEAYTAKGRVYYYNRRTRESSWNRPAKFRASSRPQTPELLNGTPHRAVISQSLGYHPSNSGSPVSVEKQTYLFCCFCGSKHEPRSFCDHFVVCKALNFHKRQSTELYQGFQRMLTVLSEDSSLRSLHYASSFPDAQPQAMSANRGDNLALLRRRQSPRKQTRTAKAQRATTSDWKKAQASKGQPQQQQQSRIPVPSTNTSSVRSKNPSSVPFEVETCRYCGRSFAEGRLAKHESVCPRVFGNEGSWGRGSPVPVPAAAGQATSSPASKLKAKSTLPKRTKISKLTDKHHLETSYKEHQAALVLCPCCKRKFAPSGAQEHIAICKGVQNRPKNPIPLLRDYAVAG